MSYTLEGVSTGTATIPKSALSLDVALDISPWDAGTGYSTIDVVQFAATIPAFNLLSSVGVDETAISLDTGALSQSVGLLQPSTGKFQLFVPFRVENNWTPQGGIGPWWAGVTGTMTDTQLQIIGLQFAHPDSDTQHTFGHDAIFSYARNALDEIPVSQFKGSAEKAQLLSAVDSLKATAALIGNDRAQLTTFHDQIDNDVRVLVDGIAGRDPGDDVLAASATTSARVRAYMATYFLHKYYYFYYTYAD